MLIVVIDQGFRLGRNMRMETPPGPSVNGPLGPCRYLYYYLDFDFENSNLYTFTSSLQPCCTLVLQGDIKPLKILIHPLLKRVVLFLICQICLHDHYSGCHPLYDRLCCYLRGQHGCFTYARQRYKLACQRVKQQ